MATDCKDNNSLDPLNRNRQNNDEGSRHDIKFNKPISSETNVIIDDPILTKDTERVTSLEGSPDYHWSWYGYSGGYVQDGFIRDDNKFVVKERFVGHSSFLFNHKDYTDTAVRDYFKNMNVKRKLSQKDDLIENDHKLKINHVTKKLHNEEEKKMKSPDVFTTNVCIKSCDSTTSNEFFTPKDENSRDIRNENVNNINDKKIVTEYIDEINVTILKEDISIEEYLLSESTAPEIVDVNMCTVYDDNYNERSYEHISYESVSVIDQQCIEVTVEEEVISENVDSVDSAKDVKNADSVKNVDSVENVKDVQNADSAKNVDSVENAKNVQNAGSLQNADSAKNVDSVENAKDVQNAGSLQNADSAKNVDSVENVKGVQNACSLENVDSIEKVDSVEKVEATKSLNETDTTNEPTKPCNESNADVITFKNIMLIHHREEGASENIANQSSEHIETDVTSQSVESSCSQLEVVEVKEETDDSRWEGLLDPTQGTPVRDDTEDYVVIDFEGSDEKWRDALKQGTSIEVK